MTVAGQPSPNAPAPLGKGVDGTASPTAQGQSSRGQVAWVSFKIRNQLFALPVTQVSEVVRVTSFSRVRDAPFPIRGVVKLHGRNLPVVDLRMRLGFPKNNLVDSIIAVAHSKGRRIGLLVDAVEQVMRIHPRDIERLPRDARTPQSNYILGMYVLDDGFVILLDLDRLLVVGK